MNWKQFLNDCKILLNADNVKPTSAKKFNAVHLAFTLQSLLEMCANTKFFLIRIFLHSG